MRKSLVSDIHIFKKSVPSAKAGDNVGLLLRGVKRPNVQRGRTVIKSGTRAQVSTTFEAEIYVLTKEEGGRHTPFFSTFGPVFHLGTSSIAGSFTFLEGREMVKAGTLAPPLLTLL